MQRGSNVMFLLAALLGCGWMAIAPPAALAENSPVTELGGDHIVEVCNPSGVREDGSFVDTALLRVMRSTGRSEPTLAGKFPETDVERIRVTGDGDAAINDLFYHRGWTDGLPIVVPTLERMRAMLEGTNLSRGDAVGVLAPMNGVATVEKVAVNAVMAGCRPVHMPFLIAAVQAIADPDFDLRGLSTTTSPDAPCIIITGPMAKEIGLNSGYNVLGRGNRGNAAIGRALQLIINNVGGSWPGVTDMSCLGSPAEHGMVLVENPDNNPWPSLNEDLGLPADANAVTVMGAEGWRVAVAHGWSGPDVIRLMGRHLTGLAYQRPRWPTILLVIPGDTAYQLAHEGYTKERIREELLRLNPVPRQEFATWFANDFWQSGVGRTLEEHPDDAVVHAPVVDHFLILYSGGQGMKNIIVPGWFGAKGPITRTIAPPRNWDELIKADKKGIF